MYVTNASHAITFSQIDIINLGLGALVALQILEKSAAKQANCLGDFGICQLATLISNNLLAVIGRQCRLL